MTATLTSAAQQGTATQPPKTRKPRKASAFVTLKEYRPGPEVTLPAKCFVLIDEASSVKSARLNGAQLEDGEYEIYCRRGKFTVSTPPAKKVVKASK